jgi:CBS domain-containing protein
VPEPAIQLGLVPLDIGQHLNGRHSRSSTNGRPVGLVTLNRIRSVPPERHATTTLRDIACTGDELALASPDEPVTDLLPRLNRCADGRALVVSGGQLVGIVSPSDISSAVQRASLRNHRQPATPPT